MSKVRSAACWGKFEGVWHHFEWSEHTQFKDGVATDERPPVELLEKEGEGGTQYGWIKTNTDWEIKDLTIYLEPIAETPQ